MNSQYTVINKICDEYVLNRSIQELLTGDSYWLHLILYDLLKISNVVGDTVSSPPLPTFSFPISISIFNYFPYFYLYIWV